MTTTPTTRMHWLMLRGLAREQRHFGAFPATFSAQLPGHTAFALDLPGFGTEHARSSPLTIAAITDDVRARFLAQRPQTTEPWGILALSLGGMVALDWAARYPQDFARVVAINTSSALSPPTERFLIHNWPKVVRANVSAPLVRERAILAMTVNRTDVDLDAKAREWAGYFLERPPQRRSFVAQLLAAGRSALPARIEPPVLVLSSSADRLVSSRCSERIAHRLGVPLELHDAAGHDLTFDAPDWVVDRVRAFGLLR